MEAVVERQVTACGKLWFKKQQEQTQIGFTPAFLQEVHTCWHVTPASLKKVEEKSPLLTIETDEGLFAVSSPVSGELYSFSEEALNFPDQLNEDTVVVVVGPERKKPEPKAKAAYVDVQVQMPGFIEENEQAIDIDWDAAQRRAMEVLARQHREREARQAEQARRAAENVRIDEAIVAAGGQFVRNVWAAPQVPQPPAPPRQGVNVNAAGFARPNPLRRPR